MSQVSFAAIKTLYLTSNPFHTALGTRFRYGKGDPAWIKVDYGVYQGTPSDVEDTFDTDIDNFSFQVESYSQNAKTCQDNMEKAEDLYNGASLVVSGYQNLRLRRSFKIPAMFDEDINTWLAVIEFEGRLFDCS